MDLQNQTPAQDKNKLLLWLLIGAVVLIVIFLLVNKGGVLMSSQPKNFVNPTSKQVWAQMPAGLPVETNAPQVLGNSASIQDGLTQYNIMFNSDKTVAENYAIYKKYCQDNGWKIEDLKALSNSVFIGTLVCSKGNVKLSVVLDNFPLPLNGTVTYAPKDQTTQQTGVLVKFYK